MANSSFISIAVLISLFIIESVINLVEHSKNYFTKDMLSNIFIGMGLMLLNNFSKFVTLSAVGFMYRFRLHTTGSGIGVWVVCFLANDLTYYLYHLASHKLRLFWILHSVHHSSEYYNISIAFRQSWFGVGTIIGLFWVWMPLAGFDPMMIMAVYQLSILYQSWLHTELIAKLPAPFEFIFNTPSHHRVHHASNPQYIDKNMGAVLIIWDRLFGTYESEVERPVYGITKPVNSVNPFVILTKSFAEIFPAHCLAMLTGAIRSHFGKMISELSAYRAKCS